MVSRKVADRTFDDLGADERKELWIHFAETASPEQLRHMAKNLRAKGEVNAPYSLEHLADLREREGWGGLGTHSARCGAFAWPIDRRRLGAPGALWHVARSNFLCILSEVSPALPLV
jgi:hypothetical protein